LDVSWLLLLASSSGRKGNELEVLGAWDNCASMEVIEVVEELSPSSSVWTLSLVLLF